MARQGKRHDKRQGKVKQSRVRRQAGKASTLQSVPSRRRASEREIQWQKIYRNGDSIVVAVAVFDDDDAAAAATAAVASITPSTLRNTLLWLAYTNRIKVK